MANLPNDSIQSKGTTGAVYPDKAVEATQALLEPLLTPDLLRKRFLQKISLTSAIRDPETGKRQTWTDDDLQEIINGAIPQAELDLKIDIMPVRRQMKFPFDAKLFEAYGYLMVPFRPVTDIIQLSVRPSNELDVYIVPLTWVETAYAHLGQLNIIPLTIAMVAGGFIPTQSSGGAAFLAIIGSRGWLPAFFYLDFVSGFKDSLIPRQLNDYIGCLAAQDVLSQLAATATNTSQSLGIDGLSQGVSTPGPQKYVQRTQELEIRAKKLKRSIRNLYGRLIVSGNV